MITKTDILLLLTDLQDKSNLDVSKQISKTLSTGVDPEIIGFINKNRQMDLYRFYEKIRKSYNDKHSPIYINIVKEITNIEDVLITLSALETQILIFAKNVENKEMFLRHSRALEISKVLAIYFNTLDATPCIKLLRLIKADIKCLQEVSK